ncbi:MAG: ATP-binding cassette domain-containing protein [Treponema sp.]|jgi:peptide/nickel transport system ATP-binding protein|nr:ATP-binding cassette domain-containing protein [Treponema sp.]
MLLEAEQAAFRYGNRGPWLFENLNFRVERGERVGLVAPSGTGKSTLIKMLAGHEKPVRGRILLDGKPLPRRGVSPVQLIYQHPEEAINPRWRMKQVVAEARMFSDEILQAMGIEPAWLERFPRELSGGELQRFCIIRSLAAQTRFLLADEISTMLDVITQAQIWELIVQETERRNLGLVLVTHNAVLAQRICSRIVNLKDLMREPVQKPAVLRHVKTEP